MSHLPGRAQEERGGNIRVSVHHAVSRSVTQDRELVEEARAGGQKAFRELVERYQALALSFAYTLTRSSALSEEIAQEAFVIAWRRLAHMQRPDRFRGWLCGIIYKVGRRRQRVELVHGPGQPGRPLREDYLPSSNPSPLERMISDEEERVLWLALGEIPEAYRAILVLYHVEEHSVDEIGEALDLTPGNVRQRLMRGRTMLRDQVLEVMKSGLRRLGPKKGFAAAVMAAVSLMGIGGTARAHELAVTKATRLRGSRRAWIAGGVGIVAIASSMFVGRLGTSPGRSRPVVMETVPAMAGRMGQVASGPNAPAGEPLSPGRVGIGRAEARAFPPSAGSDPMDEFLSFDFEDAANPRLFYAGHVTTECPAGNRHCIMGGLWPNWPSRISVGLSAYEDMGSSGTNFLFRYRPNLAVTFDYWVGDDTNFVTVEMNTCCLGQATGNFDYQLKTGVHQTWTHVMLRLVDFVPNDDVQRVLPADGSASVMSLQFFAGAVGGKPFFMDNIQVIDLDQGAIKRRSLGVSM